MKELLLSAISPPGHKYVFNFWQAYTENMAAYAGSHAFTASVVYNRSIYVFGGLNVKTNLAAAFRYDPTTDTYTALANLPQAMHGASAVAYNDKIYIFGGNRGAGSDIIVYDIAGNTYSRVAPATALPIMQYNQVAIAGDEVHIPPSNNNGAHLVYSITTNQTKSVVPPDGINAMDMSAIRCGDWVYCFGGRAARSTGAVSYKHAYRVKVSDHTVERIPDAPTGILTGSQLYQAEGKEIYIIYANSQNLVVPGIYIYIPEKAQWKTLPDPVGGLGRFGSSTGYIDNRFYFIGGWTSTERPTGINQRYQFQSWEFQNSGPGPTRLVAGDRNLGYFGEVAASDVITYGALRTHLGVPGDETNTGNWLKFMWRGRAMFLSKTWAYRKVNWETMYKAGGIYGVDGPGTYPSPSGVPVNQYKPLSITKGAETWSLIPRSVISANADAQALPAPPAGSEMAELIGRCCDSDALGDGYRNQFASFSLAALGLDNPMIGHRSSDDTTYALVLGYKSNWRAHQRVPKNDTNYGYNQAFRMALVVEGTPVIV